MDGKVCMSSLPLPTDFLDKLTRFIPPEKLTSVYESFVQKPFPAFRVNTLKTTQSDLKRDLIAAGFLLEEVSWYNNAFLLKNKSLRELTDTDLYREGRLYIQNLSSMVPVLVLNPQPDERVLDLAAAPGSKTTQMACFMQNQGEIVANDISKNRLYMLKRNLKEQNVQNTKVICSPGQRLWKNYPEYFDKTLVDAPCSMEGRFHIQNPETYQSWSQKKVKELARRQQHLLRSAISATRPHGVIVYSTCTFSPEENEGVIEWILAKEAGNIELEPLSIEHLNYEAGMTTWEKKVDTRLKYTARILPSQTMEGFFIARIRKLRSTLPEIRASLRFQTPSWQRLQ
jgi:tRNA (cytosine49-C5)-methyltransferase